jgi:hypothetical protein
MSSAEFTQWIAYANLEPFGYPMDNWRHGVRTAAVVNAVRSTIPAVKGHSRPKPVQADAYFPVKRRDELTPRQAEHLRRKRAKRSK